MSRSDETVAIGMIAAPRPDIRLVDSLKNVRCGGFDQKIYVAAEPGTITDNDDRNVELVCHRKMKGIVGNALFLYRWMLEATKSDFLLIVENDILASPQSNKKLQELLSCQGYSLRFGCVSLYTPKQYGFDVTTSETRFQGWGTLNLGWNSAAGQANCYRRDGLRHLLKHPKWVEFEKISLENHGGGGGGDTLTGDWAQSNSLNYWFHVPSLVEHLGVVSSRKGVKPTPHRQGFLVSEWRDGDGVSGA